LLTSTLLKLCHEFRAVAVGPTAAALAVAVAVGFCGGQAFAEPKAALSPKTGTASATKLAALPVVPKPGKPAKAEADYMDMVAKALTPLTEIPVSPDDAARLKDAFKAVGAKDFEKARALAGEIQDPVGRKLVDWSLLRAGAAKPGEYRAFLDANPAWADRKTLIQRAEEALFTQGGTSTEIKAFFANREAQSGMGLAALASAFLAEGNQEQAKKLAVMAWRTEDLPAGLEPGFLARFGEFLTLADHKWRLDRLLIETIRWDGEKAQRASVARRVIALLPPAEQKKANARLQVFLGAKGAKKVIDALPAEGTPDWGLVFHRIQALRRAGKNDEAAKLLLGAPTEEALTVSPDEWWVERRANAYDALKANKSKLAYELVREAGPLSVNPLKEQTFMAGWIALRYLKNPALAETHFLALRKAADGPLSRAKASYWLGRTFEARNDKAQADEQYRAALRDPDTFHALLARQKLEPGRQSISTRPPAAPTAEQLEAFLAMDAARAVVIAKKAGLDISVMRAFITQLRIALKSEADAAMVAQLAESMGDTQSAVRTAKAAIARGQNLYYYGYPVHPFPSYSALRTPPEAAFMLGIARQEPEFNTLIVSGAGAKGLLQVMTVTAKHVCQDYRIKCDIARLLTDPGYNAMLASAYIGDRMEEFSGSYVLTIAGYNAGPGRARQWIREFGDPRSPSVDPIDWIERIPIQETREYVAKVLANIQVYRARLGDEKALRLNEDLVRARSATSGAALPARDDSERDDIPGAAASENSDG